MCNRVVPKENESRFQGLFQARAYFVKSPLLREAQKRLCGVPIEIRIMSFKGQLASESGELRSLLPQHEKKVGEMVFSWQRACDEICDKVFSVVLNISVFAQVHDRCTYSKRELCSYHQNPLHSMCWCCVYRALKMFTNFLISFLVFRLSMAPKLQSVV